MIVINIFFKFRLKQFIKDNLNIEVSDENISELIKNYEENKTEKLFIINFKKLINTIRKSKKTEQQKTSIFTTIFNGFRYIGTAIANNLIGQPKKNVEDYKTIYERLPQQMKNSWNYKDTIALQNLIAHKEKLQNAIDNSKVIGFNEGTQYFVMTNVNFDSKKIIDSPFSTDGKQKEASNLKEALILLGFEIAGKDDGNIKILTQFHGLDSVHRKVEGITGHGGINHEFLLSVFHNLVNGLKKVDNGTFVNRKEIQKLLGQ